LTTCLARVALPDARRAASPSGRRAQAGGPGRPEAVSSRWRCAACLDHPACLAARMVGPSDRGPCRAAGLSAHPLQGLHRFPCRPGGFLL